MCPGATIDTGTATGRINDNDGAVQHIASDESVKTAVPGAVIDIPVIYSTQNAAGNPAALPATLISFNLHYDSDALTFVETTSIFAEDLVNGFAPDTARPESDPQLVGDDGDPGTDKAIVAAYSDSSAGIAGWPDNIGTSGQQLYVARFRVNPGFTGTTINFFTEHNRCGCRPEYRLFFHVGAGCTSGSSRVAVPFRF